MSRRLLLVTGLTLALVSSACTAPPPSEEGAPTEAAALADFYEQVPRFGPCSSFAGTEGDRTLLAVEGLECSRVSVPLDYRDVPGATGEVAVARLEARGEKIGSLLVNPGGPGGSGMLLVASMASVWQDSPLGEHFDVVGFDPRGVGASTPSVRCHTEEQRDRNQDVVPFLFGVADEEEAAAVAERCVAGTGGVAELVSVGSERVVRDMDVLRAVLGDDELTYLGYSYGSELGAMYAERFPGRVRALVLDGAVDPEVREGPFRETQFTQLQGAFDAMAAACAESATCPLGTDPAGATEAFQGLVRPLLEQPLSTSDGRELTYDDVVAATAQSLFAPSLWPALISGLDAASAGDGTALLAIRDGLLGRGPDGSYSALLSTDANLATRCMDNPRTPEEHAELLRHARAAAPFTDPGVPERSVYECSGWPEPAERDQPWVTGDVEVPPTLTISVTGDPGTPYQGGVNMARVLGGSLLTVEGVQHGVAVYGGSECVDTVVVDYLVDLRTPAPGMRCTL